MCCQLQGDHGRPVRWPRSQTSDVAPSELRRFSRGEVLDRRVSSSVSLQAPVDAGCRVLGGAADWDSAVPAAGPLVLWSLVRCLSRHCRGQKKVRTCWLLTLDALDSLPSAISFVWCFPSFFLMTLSLSLTRSHCSNQIHHVFCRSLLGGQSIALVCYPVVSAARSFFDSFSL